ncbi:MAG TPA: sodium:solute symporter family protein [Negativicutes bacterium]|nr:sodium:solute symporter family protein [Negativicutes bacterium]
MALTAGHIVGIVATLLLMIAVGLYAGSKVKSSADFATGGRQAGWSVIAGAIMGTLVSGASTIGTAQLAFQYGFSAWWFTLGAGIACAALALGTARRFYHSSTETISQYLVQTYGIAIGPISTVFGALGMFLSMISQVLAFIALMTTMFPISPAIAAAVGIVFVLCYVLFGGVWGVGLVGVAKLLLLYLAMISCGAAALIMFDGVSGLQASFPAFPWFSLFGRGVEKDLAGGFSLVVGVLSTQTYSQAIASAKTFADARKGALLSAVLIPPIGIGGILVGLFMRTNFPGTPSSEVLPTFIISYLPPVLAGVILATLLITAIGGWAGLLFGISTMFTRDIYQRFVRQQAGQREALLVQRAAIIGVVLLSAFVASGNAGSLILGWSFLSMGLRGCTILCPLLGAMFFPRYLTPTAGVLAAFLGPATNVAWFLAFPKGIDPLYPGLIASMATLLIVSWLTKKKEQGSTTA